ncbi:MAG TPA: hypothetical protein VIZ65_18240 [Cellvibrionaceae bacterium]
MNTQFTHHWLKQTAFILSLIASASCGAQQTTAPAQTAKSSTATTPAVPTAQAKCPAVAELLTVLGQKKIYEQTPELFFQSVATQLKSAKDETKALSASEKMRTLTLAATTGDWLNSGESVYTLVKDGANFNSLTLDINKICFTMPKELIELAQSTIGKGGKKIKMPAPDTSESIFWRWKDSDINMIRTLEISAAKDSYSITAKRDPDSEGVAE